MFKMKLYQLSMALSVALIALTVTTFADNPVFEVVAGRDGFKVTGNKKAEIVVGANSTFRLLITAEKGDEWQKDGSVHSFTIKELGWDFALKEGVTILDLEAPSQPGEYLVECTVKCGEAHEDMFMIMIVKP